MFHPPPPHPLPPVGSGGMPSAPIEIPPPVSNHYQPPHTPILSPAEQAPPPSILSIGPPFGAPPPAPLGSNPLPPSDMTPLKPIPPLLPSKPAEPMPIHLVEPVAPVDRPLLPSQPTEPMPIHLVEPVAPVDRPLLPSQPTEPMPVHLVEPVAPIDHPTEPTQPVELVNPPVSHSIVEPVAPVEPVNPPPAQPSPEPTTEHAQKDGSAPPAPAMEEAPTAFNINDPAPDNNESVEMDNGEMVVEDSPKDGAPVEKSETHTADDDDMQIDSPTLNDTEEESKTTET